MRAGPYIWTRSGAGPDFTGAARLKKKRGIASRWAPWLALGCACSAAVAAGQGAARVPNAPTSTLLVIQSEDEPAFDEAIAGLTHQLQKMHPDGSVKIQVRDLSKMQNPDVDLGETLKQVRPSLVVTLGSLATLWAQTSVRNIPLLFGMVLDPQSQGIDPARASTPMTGVSMQIPLSEQFARLRQVLPAVRRVGAVYDFRNQKLIDEARQETDKQGLTLVGAPVSNASEVPEAFRTLAGRVDALWSFPDTTVYSREAAQFILLFSFRNRLPLMGFSRGYVRAGALFALYADYEDVGRQMGEVAHQILGGRSPRDIPVSAPRRHSLALNMRVAEALGTEVPAAVRAKAEEVFK